MVNPNWDGSKFRIRYTYYKCISIFSFSNTAKLDNQHLVIKRTMANKKTIWHVKCLNCGHEGKVKNGGDKICKECGSINREKAIDYEIEY